MSIGVAEEKNIFLSVLQVLHWESDAFILVGLQRWLCTQTHASSSFNLQYAHQQKQNHQCTHSLPAKLCAACSRNKVQLQRSHKLGYF